MASTCVPFAFTPIGIEKKYFKDKEQFEKVEPKLVDGGVYDNQGVHKLTQPNSSYACDIVIVSDAGNSLPFKKAYNNTYTLLLRTVETFMTRIKNFQMMQHLYSSNKQKQVIYHSLSWDVENCVTGFWAGLKTGTVSYDQAKAHKLLFF